MPVVFVRREGARVLETKPALSSWTTPIIYIGSMADNLVGEAKEISGRTLYIQLQDYDFWKELVEAHILYAPSLYINYIARQMLAVEPAIKAGGNYWRNLMWRFHAEFYTYRRGGCRAREVVEEIMRSYFSSIPKLNDVWPKNQQGCKNNSSQSSGVDRGGWEDDLGIDEAIGKCRRFIVLVFAPPLGEHISISRMLGLKLSPTIASLATPVFVLANRLAKSCIDADLTVIYVYDNVRPKDDPPQLKDLRENMREYTQKVIDKVSRNKIKASIDNYFIEDKSFREIGSKRKCIEEIVKKIIEKAENGQGIDGACLLLVVRDLDKDALYNITDVLVKKIKKEKNLSSIYYAHAPEANTVYLEGLRSSQSSGKASFPVISFPIYFYKALSDSGDRLSKLFHGGNEKKTSLTLSDLKLDNAEKVLNHVYVEFFRID